MNTHNAQIVMMTRWKRARGRKKSIIARQKNEPILLLLLSCKHFQQYALAIP